MGSSLKHPVLNTGPSAEAETTIVDTIQQTQDAAVGRSESDLLVFISSVTEELKWAREEAVRTIDALTYARSWAFEFTPATSQCRTDTYLQKVREAEGFVIWTAAAANRQVSP